MNTRCFKVKSSDGMTEYFYTQEGCKYHIIYSPYTQGLYTCPASVEEAFTEPGIEALEISFEEFKKVIEEMGLNEFQTLEEAIRQMVKMYEEDLKVGW